MKTAGVVLDFYDDPKGSVLKQAFPTPEALPDIVKTAHILSSEEREVLRDDAFALVIHDNGKIFRKFACVDPGNTLLSALYYTASKDLLPAEAQKVAAINIQAACEEFGLDIPTIKTAAEGTPSKGNARNRDSMRQPLVGDEADWAARTNLVSVRGGADSGRVIPTANQMKTAGVVDVSGKDPETVFVKKTAQITALGVYPLDSYADVQKAASYFNENWAEFDPADRREFCKMASARAEELGIETPDLMRRYGAQGYADDVENHLAARRAAAPEYKELYNEMQEKRAEIEPEIFAQLLVKADEASGLNWQWGGAVADPFFSTFGETVKTANAEGVTDDQLLSLARDNGLHGVFEFAAEFNKDPVAIYDSLPADSKKIIADLAKEKTSNAFTHGTELAGLGILAKPSIDRLRGKHVDERKAAKQEVAGLGVLAAPSAAHFGNQALKKVAPKFHSNLAARVGKMVVKHAAAEKTGGALDRAAALKKGFKPKAVKMQNMTDLMKRLGHG